MFKRRIALAHILFVCGWLLTSEAMAAKRVCLVGDPTIFASQYVDINQVERLSRSTIRFARTKPARCSAVEPLSARCSGTDCAQLLADKPRSTSIVYAMAMSVGASAQAALGYKRGFKAQD